MFETIIFTILWGFVIGVLVSAPMGPTGILVIQRTLNKGRLPGLLTGLGASLSDFFYAVITVFFLGLVVGWLEHYESALQFVGSLAIALYPEYRGQGLGGAMLAKLLDALREGGWTRVSLSVQKANRALRLYRRLGFVTVEDRGEELIMVRRLDGMQSPDARRRS